MQFEGSVSALTDILLGMDMESNGWSNIVYRCIFLGMTFGQAKALSPSIAEFTELGSFLDAPIRTYSQGMILRLAFGIATAVRPEILIMDEMISAGDPQFRVRSEERLNAMLGETKIFVLGSQLEPYLKGFCETGVLLEHGRIVGTGTIDEVWSEYMRGGRPLSEVRQNHKARSLRAWGEMCRLQPALVGSGSPGFLASSGS